CRSTPELDRLRAHLSALMHLRVAADVLRHLLPADVGMSPETLRAHTLEIGEQLCDMPTTKPVAAAMHQGGSVAITRIVRERVTRQRRAWPKIIRSAAILATIR
ncbi:MAG TPA: hypothetical protein VFE41_31055, partial [Acetobacteraceae bacterium]|nr:hypothetical protein [Acetobacteraceae bacterium]